jgi:excisionase family DNA binding protein
VDKKSVAEFLGVSTRTVESYVSDEKLSVVYIRGKNGRIADFNEEEVRRFKEESQAPIHRSIVTTDSPISISPESQEAIALWAQVSAKTQYVQSLTYQLTLNLEEAAIASGISRHRLQLAAKSGELNAKKIGRSWRVRQQDLMEYVDSLWL